MKQIADKDHADADRRNGERAELFFCGVGKECRCPVADQEIGRVRKERETSGGREIEEERDGERIREAGGEHNRSNRRNDRADPQRDLSRPPRIAQQGGQAEREEHRNGDKLQDIAIEKTGTLRRGRLQSKRERVRRDMQPVAERKDQQRAQRKPPQRPTRLAAATHRDEKSDAAEEDEGRRHKAEKNIDPGPPHPVPVGDGKERVGDVHRNHQQDSQAPHPVDEGEPPLPRLLPSFRIRLHSRSH